MLGDIQNQERLPEDTVLQIFSDPLVLLDHGVDGH